MPSGRCGRRRPDQVHDCRQTDLQPTPPVPAGEREQPMLDPVPIARPRRKAADADIDAGFLRQLLQIDLPPPDPSADRAAATGDRATPVASAIRLTPLRPKLRSSAAAGRRRPFPSGCGDSASQRSRTLFDSLCRSGSCQAKFARRVCFAPREFPSKSAPFRYARFVPTAPPCPGAAAYPPLRQRGGLRRATATAPPRKSFRLPPKESRWLQVPSQTCRTSGDLGSDGSGIRPGATFSSRGLGVRLISGLTGCARAPRRKRHDFSLMDIVRNRLAAGP